MPLHASQPSVPKSGKLQQIRGIPARQCLPYLPAVTGLAQWLVELGRCPGARQTLSCSTAPRLQMHLPYGRERDFKPIGLQ
jgi:hypothetical protein